MQTRVSTLATLLAMAVALWPAASHPETDPVTVVQDRLYRVGVFLVADALVENRGRGLIDQVEVSVEFYDFFDQLLSAEYTQLRPFTLGPGQAATLRVLTPYTDRVRKLRYRFTWRQAGEQIQHVSKREVWTIGQATRDP